MLIKSPCNGFSFIEILIALAIVIILAQAAIPHFSSIFMHTKRLQAAQNLSKIALVLENFYLEHQKYTGATLSNLHLEYLRDNPDYEYKIESATENDYLLIAKPINDQEENDHCGALTLNAYGEKNITGTA